MAAANLIRPLRRHLRATHSIPLFEGDASHRHHSVALWKLWLLARLHRARSGDRLRSVETFVQFAGFPRSGHSLIGSIIDAHPQARVSHELDTMGLLKKGFSQASIFALIDRKALEFTRHGRSWNGYCYLVPEGRHERAATDDLRVIGDKKGDAAVRWIAKAPDLLDRLSNTPGPAKKWILVLRNPFDNIATMSLRKGRVYDKLRTRIRDTQTFRRELAKSQADGDIASEALDSEIDEYASLCETVAMLKHATPADSWLELRHEALASRPGPAIEQILMFLGLAPDANYVRNCSAMVKSTPNRSRDLLNWPAAKKERVNALIRRFSFLHGYEHDDVG